IHINKEPRILHSSACLKRKYNQATLVLIERMSRLSTNEYFPDSYCLKHSQSIIADNMHLAVGSLPSNDLQHSQVNYWDTDQYQRTELHQHRGLPTRCFQSKIHWPLILHLQFPEKIMKDQIS